MIVYVQKQMPLIVPNYSETPDHINKTKEIE